MTTGYRTAARPPRRRGVEAARPDTAHAPSGAPPGRPIDVGELDRLLGADLVEELRHLERAYARRRAFRDGTGGSPPASATERRMFGRSIEPLSDVVLHHRRREIEAACADAERAVAVLLLEVRRRHERAARPGTGEAAGPGGEAAAAARQAAPARRARAPAPAT